jgi:cyclopropane fatty-acyl-phospholipid synthase-like methyltransferase
MTEQETVAGHWGRADIFNRMMTAIREAGLDDKALTVEDLAAMDHLHARGFLATKELEAMLPVTKGDHLLDIGCGEGGPAHYLATRFDCTFDGIDITPEFVEAG